MSKAAPKKGGKGAAGGFTLAKRLQTVGLFVTVVAVGALAGSMAWGFRESGAGGAGAGSAPVGEARTGPVPEPPADRIRVEVLNASGRTGLAREATRLLRDRGFDVVHFGNAGGRRGDTTLVLERGSRDGAGQDVADALGGGRVGRERDTTAMVDVTVILGKDWHRQGQGAGAVPPAPDTAGTSPGAGEAP